MSRTRKSAWSLATGVLFNLIWVVTGFIATPWLLRWLGSERFGIYRVLLEWIGYLMLFELALAGALMASLAPKVAHGDKGSVRRMLASGLQAYIWIILCTVAGGTVLVVALPHVIRLTEVTTSELRLAGIISLFVAFLAPMAIFRSLAETRQKQYLYNLLITVQAILMTILWVIAAKAGWGLPGQSLAFVLAQIPTAIVLLWDATREYGWIFSTSPDPSTTKALLKLNQPTLIHNVTDRIALISDNILVGWILGPFAVVPFYLTQRVMILTQMQLQSLNHSTWAALAELYSQGKTELLRTRLLEITSTIGGMGISVLGPIAAFNHHLITKWVGGFNYAGEIITITASINIWLWAIYSSWIWPLFATGQIGRWAPFAILFVVLKIAASIFLIYTVGLVGPLLGTFAAFLFLDSWALPKILKEAFQLSPSTLWRTALAPLGWGLPYGAILWVAAQNYTPSGLAELLLEMGAAMMGGFLLYWIFSLDQNARKEWRYRLKLVMNA